MAATVRVMNIVCVWNLCFTKSYCWFSSHLQTSSVKSCSTAQGDLGISHRKQVCFLKKEYIKSSDQRFFYHVELGYSGKNTSSTCKVQPWWWCGADTEQFWVKILHHNRQLCNPLWSQIAWWFIRHRRQRYRSTLIVPSCKPLWR